MLAFEVSVFEFEAATAGGDVAGAGGGAVVPGRSTGAVVAADRLSTPAPELLTFSTVEATAADADSIAERSLRFTEDEGADSTALAAGETGGDAAADAEGEEEEENSEGGDEGEEGGSGERFTAAAGVCVGDNGASL